MGYLYRHCSGHVSISRGFCYFLQVVAAGANPVQITRGIEKTAKALVSELQKMSKEVTFGYDFVLFRKYISVFHGTLLTFAVGQLLHYNTIALST